MTPSNDNFQSARQLDDWTRHATVEEIEERLSAPPLDDDFDIPPWPSLAGLLAGEGR